MVYVIRAAGTDFYKIGYTGGSIEARMRQISTYCPHELTIFCVIDGGRLMEKEIHRTLRVYHARNEWFSVPLHEANSLLNLARLHPWNPNAS